MADSTLYTNAVAIYDFENNLNDTTGSYNLSGNRVSLLYLPSSGHGMLVTLSSCLVVGRMAYLLWIEPSLSV